MVKNKDKPRAVRHAGLSGLSALLLCVLLLLSTAVTPRAEGASEVYTVAQVESLRDGIVAYNGASGGQDMIDRCLTPQAGVSAEFYAIALSQTGSYRFDGYESALLSYLNSHNISSASSREKYALALAAAGSTNSYIADTADEAIDGLGIMSRVFGLHLLNNGYDSAMYSVDGLIADILSYRTGDGGWSVMGSYGDVDVTAMTLQALAPYYGRRSDVTAAVDQALQLLSDRQLSSGGYKTMGTENSESAAQVIIALSALGIDAQRDARFCKNGSSVMDAMISYRLSNGGFSHAGGGADMTATEEAFCALTAYARYCYGQGSLYVLDHVNHASPSSGGHQSGSQNSGGQQSGGSQSQSGGSRDQSSQNGGSGSSASGKGSGGATASDNGKQTDADGNRIVVIDGRRYVEATDAAGELMTIAVEETDASATAAKPTYGGFQSSATADTGICGDATADESSGGSGYKLIAVLAVFGAAGAACGVLFLLKKHNKKNYIAVGVIAAAGILFILLTDFKSADSYRQPAKTDGDLQVTLSIRCDTIKDREKVNSFIPDDGVILDTETFYADEGDTVFDVLMQAVSAHSIPLDNRGAKGAAYIAGINCLYEFDYGELSGWMYRVNGEFPDVGCQSYTVSDGDVIEWVYTTNIGKDLQTDNE